jgi:hypothetical protein
MKEMNKRVNKRKKKMNNRLKPTLTKELSGTEGPPKPPSPFSRPINRHLKSLAR